MKQDCCCWPGQSDLKLCIKSLILIWGVSLPYQYLTWTLKIHFSMTTLTSHFYYFGLLVKRQTIANTVTKWTEMKPKISWPGALKGGAEVTFTLPPPPPPSLYFWCFLTIARYSSTSSGEPTTKGTRWWMDSGLTSRTLCVPVVAMPPACSMRKAMGLHSYRSLSWGEESEAERETKCYWELRPMGYGKSFLF